MRVYGGYFNNEAQCIVNFDEIDKHVFENFIDEYCGFVQFTGNFAIAHYRGVKIQYINECRINYAFISCAGATCIDRIIELVWFIKKELKYTYIVNNFGYDFDFEDEPRNLRKPTNPKL